MDYDVIIIGAGAAGMMCALTAAQRGRRVLLLDHAKKIGEKIRISGGGRCNFTNIHAGPSHYLSGNPHFCKSALKQYSQHDFIALVEKHGIAYHEKTLGQLFCDESAQQIIDMLLKECADAGAVLRAETAVHSVRAQGGGYCVTSSAGEELNAPALVVATGGLSIPKIGASKFGYDLARQFDIPVIETRAGLVPLTFQADFLARCKALSGVSVEAVVSCGKTEFAEGLLFTHRGLSGPSILQISSYWREGEEITVNFAPSCDAFATLKAHKADQPKQDIKTAAANLLPARVAESFCSLAGLEGRIADQSDKKLRRLAELIHNLRVKPSGTEGYRTAEVTLGGVDTHAVSSKTMEAKTQPGLYFIGEVLDVTGHLGGFNFQWAWSSGYVAGQNI